MVMAFDFKKHLSFVKAKQAPIAKDRNVVGIDIGSSSIKVVQLKFTGKTATLVTYGELQLGPYTGSDLGRLPPCPNKNSPSPWLMLFVNLLLPVRPVYWPSPTPPVL